MDSSRFWVLRIFFEFFIRLDGTPLFAFFVTLGSGFTNLGLGICGAGIASSAGVGVAVVMGLFYFIFLSRTLKPVPPLADLKFLGQTMANGSSEMATELSTAVKMLVFNQVIIRHAGEAGVAALACGGGVLALWLWLQKGLMRA